MASLRRCCTFGWQIIVSLVWQSYARHSVAATASSVIVAYSRERLRTDLCIKVMFQKRRGRVMENKFLFWPWRGFFATFFGISKFLQFLLWFWLFLFWEFSYFSQDSLSFLLILSPFRDVKRPGHILKFPQQSGIFLTDPLLLHFEHQRSCPFR